MRKQLTIEEFKFKLRSALNKRESYVVRECDKKFKESERLREELINHNQAQCDEINRLRSEVNRLKNLDVLDLQADLLGPY